MRDTNAMAQRIVHLCKIAQSIDTRSSMQAPRVLVCATS